MIYYHTCIMMICSSLLDIYRPLHCHSGSIPCMIPDNRPPTPAPTLSLCYIPGAHTSAKYGGTHIGSSLLAVCRG